MVQSANSGKHDNTTHFSRLDRPCFWRIFVQRQVSSAPPPPSTSSPSGVIGVSTPVWASFRTRSSKGSCREFRGGSIKARPYFMYTRLHQPSSLRCHTSVNIIENAAKKAAENLGGSRWRLWVFVGRFYQFRPLNLVMPCHWSVGQLRPRSEVPASTL